MWIKYVIIFSAYKLQSIAYLKIKLNIRKIWATEMIEHLYDISN